MVVALSSFNKMERYEMIKVLTVKDGGFSFMKISSRVGRFRGSLLEYIREGDKVYFDLFYIVGIIAYFRT